MKTFSQPPPYGVKMYDVETRYVGPIDALPPADKESECSTGWCVKCRCYSLINSTTRLCTQPPFSCHFALPGEPPPGLEPKTAG